MAWFDAEAGRRRVSKEADAQIDNILTAYAKAWSGR